MAHNCFACFGVFVLTSVVLTASYPVVNSSVNDVSGMVTGNIRQKVGNSHEIGRQRLGKLTDDPGDDAVMELRAFNPLFSPRYDAALVFHSFGLFLMGGVSVELTSLRAGQTVSSSPVTFYNDVYLSNDEGQSWTYVGIANWWPRAAFGAASFGEYIYVYGGIGISLFSEISCFNDVWASQDGVHWNIVNIGIARCGA
jgi:hypothetical protein